MTTDIAVIGGSGLSDLALDGARDERIVTPYGEAAVRFGSWDGAPVVFLARHGAGHRLPPHRINHRANIRALRDLGVRYALATSAVGSLRADLPPGSFVLLSDFLDLTRPAEGGPWTFFADEVVHTDFSEPYCRQLRAAALNAAVATGLALRPEGVYVSAPGPRYETPAEVRLYARWGGDVVGMTGAPEAILCREAGICYASIALVTNLGSGLGDQPLAHDEVVEMMESRGDELRRLILQTIRELPELGKYGS